MTGPRPAAPAALSTWPEHLQPGRAIEIAPGVTRVVAPNPGMMTGPGTNTYLLGSDRLALVDPGPIDDQHERRLLEEAGDRLRWILVTHTHIDHSPLAAALKDATGAEIVAFGPAPPAPPTVPGRKITHLDTHDMSFAPDRLLADGDTLDTGEMLVAAVYTPGHTSNHLCFEIEGTGLLFSGDHVMSGSTVVIAPPDGDMAVYLESLEKVRSRRPRRIAPGHGDMIDDPGAVLDGYLRHRLEREAQVLAQLRAGDAGHGSTGAGVVIDDLVAAIYVEVPKELHPVARFSVWAHLRKLRAEGRARSDEPEDIDARWYLAARA
ncbi:MAG TPA: MBL fold metallo-hydrolase [Acidimicrobiales bacterium]|nr:MBL fold metallo-hydrolase [Acidimicrobiales bacterium]